MPNLSVRLADLPLSGIRQMMDLARRTPDIIRLEVGDPDAQTPSYITEGAFRWAASTRVGYPPTAGYQDLREAISRKLIESNGIEAPADDVVVTVGATGALFLSLHAIIDPDDEVLVPDPGWAGYPAMVATAGGRLATYQLDAEDDFQLRADAVRNAVTDRTRAIILNSPNNPTGAVADRTELGAVLEVAASHDLWVLSDECYEDLIFEGEHVSPATLSEDAASRTVSIYSFSKSYAMTGWRVGYCTAPPEVASGIARLQSPAVASPSGISQRGALEALEGPKDATEEMRQTYLRRRRLATALLDDADTRYVYPAGAFYLLLDLRDREADSMTLAKELVMKAGVCTTPGSAFGNAGEGFLRVSLACPDDQLREGLKRIVGYLRGQLSS